MFMCLGLSFVCHAMCYCSLFVPCITFSCVLAYWFGPDLDLMVFVIIHKRRPTSKGLDHPICMSMLACFYDLCLLASMLYACASLSCFRLFHAWRLLWAWSCLVTFDTHEALFGCDHLGGISGCQVAPCIPFPFPLRAMLCLPCLFAPPIGFLCIFTRLLTCPCMSLAC